MADRSKQVDFSRPTGRPYVPFFQEPAPPVVATTTGTEKFMMRPITGVDPDTGEKKELERIYALGGTPRTKAEFDTAYKQYRNGETPEGFTVLQPGVINTLRRSFETVNEPVQKYAPQVGATVASHIPGLGIAETLKPGITQTVQQGGADAAQALAEQYNTPGKLGLQAGLMLAAPALGPVTSSINTGVNAGKVAANRLGILSNIGKSTLAGGTGSVLMDAVFGEPTPFDTPKLVADFGAAFATGGLQAGVGYLINKFVSPKLHEQVATDILKPIADRYPNYKTDPTLFAAATSSPQKLKDITVAMAKGMRGTLDDVADTYKNEIVNVIPRAMSVGDQATLRAHLRRSVRAGNEILDNMDDPKAQDIARQALQDAVNETGKFVADTMKKAGVANFSKADAQVAAVTGKLKTDLANFTEGARVLDAMRQSGQQNGFDPMAFRDILVGKTTSGQQDLMGEVARKLGMGQPLQAAPTVPEDPSTAAFDLLKKYVPGIKQIANIMNVTKGEPTAGKLPWQLQQGALPRATAIGVASEGKEAIDSFMNRKSK